jgi:hypothetical protein
VGCPCLSAETVAQFTVNTSFATIEGKQYSAFGPNTTYPENYGVLCGIHDTMLEPYCTPQWCASGEAITRFCSEPFCWVDVDNCDGVAAPSFTFYFAPVSAALLAPRRRRRSQRCHRRDPHALPAAPPSAGEARVLL